MNRHEQIAKYYQDSDWLYRLFCYNKGTLGMHFGFWEKDTPNRQQAILNQNKVNIVKGQIKKHHKVLDAGCGVGGTAIYIAKTTGAQVTGISLSEFQIHKARNYAARNNVGHLTTFEVQDFCKTTFPSESFDVICAMESSCYVYPKQKFLTEAYRLLKPGGRLVISDGYPSKDKLNLVEKRLLTQFRWAFVLPTMVTGSKMTTDIQKAGFINTRGISMMKKVEPSVRYFYRLSKLVSILKWINQSVYRNYVALSTAGKMYELGLADYWLHWAVKPARLKSATIGQ